MRAIGNQPIVDRYVGEEQVIARYYRDKLIYPEYIKDALALHFDGIDNEGTGVHNPTAPKWVDLVGGIQATLEGVTWTDAGLDFLGSNSLVSYSPGRSGQILEFTISFVHNPTAAGNYPRLNAERPFPTLYLRSTLYQYNLYAFAQDAPWVPSVFPIFGQRNNVSMRRAGSGPVELFVDGVYAGQVAVTGTNSTWLATQFIGNRADKTRGFHGEICDHKVYTRALSNDEIYRNYQVDKLRYGVV